MIAAGIVMVVFAWFTEVTEAGGRRLEAGGWRLEAGGWRPEAGGWRVEVGGRRLRERFRTVLEFSL
jgi:hypothetical protein